MGALLFRAILIVAGVEIIERFHWTTIIFGVILFGAAYRTMLHDPRQARKSGIIEWLSRHFKVTEERNASGLFVKEEGVRKVTPLFIAIIALELTDILFAVDSVPAALSISRNVFVVYSSNAFAILGLRSLYLAMHGLLERYKYLHYGLGVILFLAGVKITLSNWLEIPAWAATTATILVLVMTITLSPREEPTRPNHQRAARR
jgi:tellurite resistance protein TerC